MRLLPAKRRLLPPAIAIETRLCGSYVVALVATAITQHIRGGSNGGQEHHPARRVPARLPLTGLLASSGCELSRRGRAVLLQASKTDIDVIWPDEFASAKAIFPRPKLG